MITVAKALDVSRSNLYARRQPAKNPRGYYVKKNDEDILPLIKKIIVEHPSYGYRRVCALCNRELRAQGKQPVNHKRVYRIMKKNNMLLPAYTSRHETRLHLGKVEVTERNKRWCGDGFEIPCDNGEKVRVIFGMDCCDREVMAYAASVGGYTSDMAQSVVLSCVERRFHGMAKAAGVEWLTDNGSCFIAKETKKFARELGVLCRFTPVRSPQSNGMAESLVKTMKRDYVFCNARPDAATVIRKLPQWFDDYNENAPHKALGMRSPREFIWDYEAGSQISPGAASLVVNA